MRDALLDVRDLAIAYKTRAGDVMAVQAARFTLQQGEVLGVVGESGSGKSTLGLGLLRLLSPPGRVSGGAAWFGGRDLITMPDSAFRALRGDRLAMIFQNPMSALNPTETIGAQIAETIRTHRQLSREALHDRCVELLELVGIPAPAMRLRGFPHEFSGGMRQRALIALALALEPDLLVADEPTTALDLTVQAQIVWLLEQIQQRARMGLIFITHNLALAGTISHRIAVMYAGWIVEIAPTAEMLRHPAHPYAQGLIASVPAGHWRERRIRPIPGHAPVGVADAPGCPFMPRCARATAACGEAMPPPREVAPGHVVRCVHAG